MELSSHLPHFDDTLLQSTENGVVGREPLALALVVGVPGPSLGFATALNPTAEVTTVMANLGSVRDATLESVARVKTLWKPNLNTQFILIYHSRRQVGQLEARQVCRQMRLGTKTHV